MGGGASKDAKALEAQLAAAKDELYELKKMAEAQAIEQSKAKVAATADTSEFTSELTLDSYHSVKLPSYSASHSDHAKHVWVTIKLPPGWASEFRGGKLHVTWKDQGWGNCKGHLWARVAGDTSVQAVGAPVDP